MPYTVVAEGIRKSFGGRAVLDGVDLTLERGSVLGLLGPNGAGKTTLVRILATLVRPDGGRATIAGHDLAADPVGVRGVISLTGQYAAVDDVLTGRENLEMMAGLLHLPRRARRARVAELLVEFGLTDAQDRRVGTYSGGMRRRLDLAASMIRCPELLFLDEPTTGLDPRSREQLWHTVRRLAEQAVTILLTTQYLEEADQLADTVAMLTGGRIVARGTPDELKSSLGAEIVRLRFPDVRAFRTALAAGGATRAGAAAGALIAEDADEQALTIDIATDGSATRLRELLTAVAATGAASPRVSTHRPSLDDVFLSLTAAAPSTPEPRRVPEPAP
ncbi:ATP-binding cassette domain-containing protein [Frankia sp. AgB32]|uniref:ATP-binding cassette domain-containing protein n=1 Tax=Frankia sp. AgB32 TaxID=631119 RepID=UPI00200BD09C|nr:ATP-binding cassette domain-containing protein [Frankia sp. AgB32]MCK9897143.1 ATP-binding cassette domain-containing protein [Frankia sp. AgB32]